MKEKRYCAHRGFNAVAPENTLPAFAEAVALGADEIEFDLWPTADGQLVVCHDPAVDRTTDGTGTICDMTCEEIRGFDAGVKFCEEYAGVRLPLFEEVLQQFAGRVVMNIHIKSLGRPVIENAVMMERGRELSKVYLKNRPLPMPLSDPVEEVLTELEETPCEPYDEKILRQIVSLLNQYHCTDMVYLTGEKDVLQTSLKVALI